MHAAALSRGRRGAQLGEAVVYRTPARRSSRAISPAAATCARTSETGDPRPHTERARMCRKSYTCYLCSSPFAYAPTRCRDSWSIVLAWEGLHSRVFIVAMSVRFLVRGSSPGAHPPRSRRVAGCMCMCMCIC